MHSLYQYLQLYIVKHSVDRKLIKIAIELLYQPCRELKQQYLILKPKKQANNTFWGI